MNILIDIIVILLILGLTYLGYKRGLTGVIIKLISFVLSLVVALILFKPISYFIINNTPLYNNLAKSVEEKLIKDNKTTGENADGELKSNEEPNAIVKSVNKEINKSENKVKKSVAEYIAEVIINIIVAISIYIILRIAMFCLSFTFKFISELPIIHQFDKIGGTIYGLLESLLIIYILLAIISLINVSELQLAIQTSYITSWLYNNNLILLFFF